MATSVTINGNSYFIAEQSDSSPWGEDLHDLLVALTTIANNTFSTGDIAKTNFTVANNQAVAADITGLSFDTAIVRSATITYSAYRSTNINEVSEHGQLFITYKSTAATWEIVRFAAGDAELQFTITSSGQLQYTSSNLAGTSYNSLLKFEAKAYLQT